MNFARVVCTIFGGKGSKIKVACLVYLVRCLYPSDVYEWYSTVVNDRLEIHLFPFRPFTPPRFVFSSSFLSLSLSLSLFFPPLLSSCWVRRSGWNRALDLDSRDRSMERLCLQHSKQGRKQSKLPRVVEAGTCLARCERMEEGWRKREREHPCISC